MKRDNSILTDDLKKCFFCGSKATDIHEVFYGNKRTKSIIDGCYVGLCKNCHTMTNYSVHFNHKRDITLKQYAQEKWEETYGTREDFIKRYGRNYLC